MRARLLSPARPAPERQDGGQDRLARSHARARARASPLIKALNRFDSFCVSRRRVVKPARRRFIRGAVCLSPVCGASAPGRNESGRLSAPLVQREKERRPMTRRVRALLALAATNDSHTHTPLASAPAASKRVARFAAVTYGLLL